ncbi:NUDIX domain-containing protein [Caldifermentibacillus hisashii]|jgi:8-oxo-dGTP diphosphatase|uniref:NUDIX hydrolase n=1 Tax=Bacillaceae TaxID=186817 RepID=UPI0022E4AC2E|nr:NUDIX domain-containing protein [Caldibacillus thermoamylovorans]
MELWDVYDINRKKTGKTHLRSVPLPEGSYHLVVHAIIENERGEVLISKRHPTKPYGNLWECNGGSVLAGETSLQGILREIKEEIGIDLNPDNGKIIRQETRDCSHYDLWYFQQNANIHDLTLQAEEVSDAKWVNQKEYDVMVTNQEIVPSIDHYFRLVFKNRREK